MGNWFCWGKIITGNGSNRWTTAPCPYHLNHHWVQAPLTWGSLRPTAILEDIRTGWKGAHGNTAGWDKSCFSRVSENKGIYQDHLAVETQTKAYTCKECEAIAEVWLLTLLLVPPTVRGINSMSTLWTSEHMRQNWGCLRDRATSGCYPALVERERPSLSQSQVWPLWTWFADLEPSSFLQSESPNVSTWDWYALSWKGRWRKLFLVFGGVQQICFLCLPTGTLK